MDQHSLNFYELLQNMSRLDLMLLQSYVAHPGAQRFWSWGLLTSNTPCSNRQAILRESPCFSPQNSPTIAPRGTMALQLFTWRIL
jgi:hypothetical protein